jgi:uncharacterized membrane protein YdcZ (DUF606 family)
VTPVVVVTGYFSTQEQVFGFARNARSFMVGLFVVFIVLQLLDLITSVSKGMTKISWWKDKLAGTMLGRRLRLTRDKKLSINGKSVCICLA